MTLWAMLLLCRLDICSSTTTIALCSQHGSHVRIPEFQSSHSLGTQPKTPKLSQVRRIMNNDTNKEIPTQRISLVGHVCNYAEINQRTLLGSMNFHQALR